MADVGWCWISGKRVRKEMENVMNTNKWEEEQLLIKEGMGSGAAVLHEPYACMVLDAGLDADEDEDEDENIEENET